MISEKEILNLIKSRKKEAFNIIAKEYSQKLYWLIRKMVLSHDDTNDILQNVFIKIWTNLDSFKGNSKLYTWLYRIAINETYTFLNKERARLQSGFTDLEDEMIKNLKSDSFFSGDEIQLKLQKAILSLPEKQRLVFNMKYYDEMKYDEMSEILGTSTGALKASYHHAVKKIQAFLNIED